MQTVVGLFDSKTEAEATVRRLQTSGFRNDVIGVALRDARTMEEMAEATGVEVGDLSEEGAAAGAVSGAGVGILVGLALLGTNLVLPGLGTFLVGGPLAAALVGAGLGAASGGLIGGLIGLGIPEHEAEHYAAGLEKGGVLVSVQAGEGHVDIARKIMDEEGARRTHVVDTSTAVPSE